jgi:predicted small secreted protein
MTISNVVIRLKLEKLKPLSQDAGKDPMALKLALDNLLASQIELPDSYTKEKLMIKRLVIAFFATGLLMIASTGCNTVHGAGEDIEHAGDKIQEKTQP